MAHWDGFQSARTRQRDCWTLEISVLNPGEHFCRCSFPIMFIPISCAKLIHENSGNVLRACLEPFVTELEEIFTEGFKIRFSYKLETISESVEAYNIEDVVLLRTILLNFMGDHHAQSKVGLLKGGGYLACRRYDIFSCMEDISTDRGKILYEQNKKHARFNPPWRTAENLLEALTNWRYMPKGAERARLERLGGISRHFIMWRLYDLYGFNLSTDLVYDIMHVLALCIFKKYVHLFVKNMTEMERESELEETLHIISQPTCKSKCLGHRWLISITTLGFFKAEEYTNFVLWCLSFVLDKLGIENI